MILFFFWPSCVLHLPGVTELVPLIPNAVCFKSWLRNGGGGLNSLFPHPVWQTSSPHSCPRRRPGTPTPSPSLTPVYAACAPQDRRSLFMDRALVHVELLHWEAAGDDFRVARRLAQCIPPIQQRAAYHKACARGGPPGIRTARKALFPGAQVELYTEERKRGENERGSDLSTPGESLAPWLLRQPKRRWV